MQADGAIIEAIYDSVLDDTSWSLVLEAIAMRFNAPWFAVAIQSADSVYLVGDNLDPDCTARFAADHWMEDVWGQAARGAPSGTVMSGAAICLPKDLPGGLLNNVLIPADVGDSIAVKGHKGRHWEATFAIYRRYRQDLFSRRDLKHMAAYAGHLARAAEIREHLAGRMQTAWDLDQALYRSPMPIFLVDETMRITWFNPKGEALMEAHAARPAEVRKNRLLLGTQEDELDLQDAVYHAVRGRKASRVMLRRRNHRLPLVAHVTPLGNRLVEDRIQTWAPPSVRRRCLVIVRDPAAPPATPEDLLQDYFGLSEAEAALARCVGSGMTLDDLSDRLQVPKRILRGDLDRILAKMEMQSDGELVRVLSRLSED